MHVAPRTWRLAALPAAVGIGLLALSSGWGILALLAVGFVLWFHRDPDRAPSPNGYLSPADGTVSVVRQEGDRVRVGVFMGVTDVHVNRSPASGTIRAVEHVPGAHRPAYTKESERNERVHVTIDDLEVTLIAGAFARRIHPYVAVGERVERGDRIGHVSFGSRADVVFPPAVELADIRVDTGDTVRAGETILAAAPT